MNKPIIICILIIMGWAGIPAGLAIGLAWACYQSGRRINATG